MKKKLESKKMWMGFAEDLFKEKELRNKTLGELTEAMREIFESSCSILKTRNIDRRYLEPKLTNTDDWRTEIEDVICTGGKRAAFNIQNFWIPYWKKTLNKFVIA